MPNTKEPARCAFCGVQAVRKAEVFIHAKTARRLQVVGDHPPLERQRILIALCEDCQLSALYSPEFGNGALTRIEYE